MRIIERYLLRDFLVYLIYISLVFILLYMIVDLFGHLDEIIREHVGLRILLRYYLNYLPIIFSQILPFASLVAVIYCLGNLQRYNEIVALYASGINLSKIIRPYLITSLVLSIVIFVLNEKVNPSSFMVMNNLKENFSRDKKEKPKGYLNNVTLYGQANRIIYARSYDLEKKILYDLIILEHNEQEMLTSRITAKLAVWQDKKWILYGILLYRLDPEGRIIGQPQYFDDKEMDLTDRPQDFLRQDFLVEVMDSGELRRYINRFKGGSEKITRRLLVELHFKKSAPFSTFVLTLIGLPFALLQNMLGKKVGLGIGFGTGILFYGLNAVSLALGKLGILPPIISAWLVTVVFIFSGIVLLQRCPR